MQSIRNLFKLCLLLLFAFIAGVYYDYAYLCPARSNNALDLDVPAETSTPPPWKKSFSTPPPWDKDYIDPNRTTRFNTTRSYDYEPQIAPIAAVLCAPGIFVISAIRSLLNQMSDPVVRNLLGYRNSLFYINPNSLAEWLFAIFFSWWFWTTAARMAWVIPARQLGTYDATNFHKWLRFSIPWRPLYGIWLARVTKRREEIFKVGNTASARFTSSLEKMFMVWKPGDVYLGNHRALTLPFFQPIGMENKGHLCIGAGSGGGKTTLLMTILSLHEGTALIIDPKGQIARGLAMRMGKGGNGIEGKGMKVCIFDPKHIVSGYGRRARWNPFLELDRAVERQKMRNKEELSGNHRGFKPPTIDELPHPDFAAENFAQKMVECMVLNEKGHINDFWDKATKQLLQALILHIYCTESPANCNIARLWELLNVGKPDKATDKITPFKALLLEMSANPRFQNVIKAAALSNLEAPGKTEGNILMTMRANLEWMKNSYVQQSSASSDFFLEELKTGKLVLFLCAPVTTLTGELLNIFRMLCELSMLVFEEYGDNYGDSKKTCLFALDEFPSLGHIPAIETGAAVMRSYGVRLLCIFQNTGQLGEVYKNWKTFLSNASVIWWLGISHEDNLEYLEKRLGKRRVNRIVEGKRWWWPFKTRATRVQTEEHTVMDKDQIERLSTADYGMMIVERPGNRPLALASAPYFKELPEKFFEPSTNHKPPRLRQWTRKRIEEAALLEKLRREKGNSHG